jgi:hypothetical protein
MNNTKKEPQKKNESSGSSGFLPFAVFVFTALAVGLVVILLRSQA